MIAGIDSLNARDFEFSTPGGQQPKERLSPHIEVTSDHISSVPMTWDVACETLKVLFQARPDLRYEVRNTSWGINQDCYSGTQVVYMELDMEEVSFGVTVHGMSTYTWKRNGKDRWQWQRFCNMRNMSGNQGLV